MTKLEGTLGQVDSLLITVNSVFDTTAKTDLRSAIHHLNGTLGHLSTATNSLNGMLANNGAVNGTFKNLEAVTANLKNNNEKITGILDNADKTMSTLANGELDHTLKSPEEMSNNLNATIAKLNSTDGTAGLLLNDKKVYNNLRVTLGSLNKLLEDLRYNPKRYVHFSLFGKRPKYSLSRRIRHNNQHYAQSFYIPVYSYYFDRNGRFFLCQRPAATGKANSLRCISIPEK
ncbi:hypothetical protein MKQ70_02420 [Chitinophaga sedimenti]|uniref:MlaD family protein n=1 Tax=Chitinophaga sedimenti TaxID=2033606 RepID=UPI0020039E39|nr:hypothetical protein [Chitinophaga sedimenti]MCK7553924.1 hypothetical protein [Chitinophaga sedimenti]